MTNVNHTEILRTSAEEATRRILSPVVFDAMVTARIAMPGIMREAALTCFVENRTGLDVASLRYYLKAIGF